MAALLIALAVFLLLGIPVTRSATRTWTGSGLSPCIYPELARTDSVMFAAGTYAAGQVMGQATTLTAVNDVQTITFGGTPTGGTFRLSFAGQETADITWSGTAATLAARITAALEALSFVGAGNVTTSASITVPAVTFQADLAGRRMPLMTASVNALTSGTTATIAIAHTTFGSAAGGTWAAYDDSLADGTNIAKAICQYATYVTPNGRHYLGTGDATGRFEWSAPVYVAGYFRTADLTGIDANGVTDLGRIVEGAVASLTSVATVLKVN